MSRGRKPGLRNWNRIYSILGEYEACPNIVMVAKRLGISHQAVSQALAVAGSSPRAIFNGVPFVYRHNQQLADETISLYRTLRSAAKVAQNLGIPLSSVRWLLKERGEQRKANGPQVFWERVHRTPEPNKCWPWLGLVQQRGGYGQMSYQGKTRFAHQLAYLFTYGTLPQRPLQLRHVCGNARCCNPSHLQPGTITENMEDRSRHRLDRKLQK